MKARFNQKGFATWELALGLLVIAVIGFAGYHVYSSHKNNNASTTQPATNSSLTTTTSTSVPTAPTVTNTADLDKAAALLNQTDPSSSNSSDNSQLSSQANF